MRTNGNLAVGIILIALGILFLLDSLDVVTDNIHTYWPVILIAIGSLGWLSQGPRPSFGNVLAIALGVLFLIANLSDTIEFRELWPVLIILIGINIVLRPRSSRKRWR